MMLQISSLGVLRRIYGWKKQIHNFLRVISTRGTTSMFRFFRYRY